MPIKRCTSDDKPGYKWGDEGKCYTYNTDDEGSRREAEKKARIQGIAIGEYWNVIGSSGDYPSEPSDK